MTITYKNLYDINKINLHDAYIENILYNHSEKNIKIRLENKWENGDYNLDFQNVLYYEMTCCDFWGSGYNVACWSILDATEIFDKLLRLEKVEKAKSFSSDPKSHTYMDLHEYFGIDILINSGDRLKIICKLIDINQF